MTVIMEPECSVTETYRTPDRGMVSMAIASVSEWLPVTTTWWFNEFITGVQWKTAEWMSCSLSSECQGQRGSVQALGSRCPALFRGSDISPRTLRAEGGNPGLNLPSQSEIWKGPKEQWSRSLYWSSQEITPKYPWEKGWEENQPPNSNIIHIERIEERISLQ